MMSLYHYSFARLPYIMIVCALLFTGSVNAELSIIPDPQISGILTGNVWSADRSGLWTPYVHKYAIVVMGGSVSGQMYKWYWNDTSSLVWALMDWEFAPQDIYYFSYGDSASAHPELVDGISTYANVEAAFESVAAKATEDDLVHVWWVDHGNTSGFEVHGGFVTFTVLREWIDDILCKAYIGAYNPCFSGAIMPHMSGLCNSTRRVITATSVNASQGNSYGWAGKWRFSMRGGAPDAIVSHYTDVNGDGYIAIDEAYEWETPHSNDVGEYPLLDDNCDGIGGDLTNPSTYDPYGTNSTLDGYYSQFYSLMAWYDTTATLLDVNPFQQSAQLRFGRNSDSYCNESARGVDIDWSTGAPMPSPVCRGASGIINGKVYLFGGHPSPAPVHYVYDIETDTWSTEAAPLPTPGSLTRGVVYNDKLYLFGGHTTGSDTLRRYDPLTNSWELLSTPYPDSWRECCKYGAAVVNDEIHYYYVEEYYSYLPLLSSWHYDIPGNFWVEASTPPSPRRMYFFSASDGEYCYAVGGIAHDTELSVLTDAIRYDPSTDEWNTIDSLPEPTAFADGDFLGDYLYIAGGGAGYDPWPASDKVYAWNEATGWLTATPLPAPVGCPHVEVTTIGDKDYILVFGGNNEGYLNTLYIGEIELTGIEDETGIAPYGVRLLQNCPNPFNSITQIAYEIPVACDVCLEVFDITGRKIATLVDSWQDPGTRNAVWNAIGVPSGVYFYRISVQDETAVRRMVVLE